MPKGVHIVAVMAIGVAGALVRQGPATADSPMLFAQNGAALPPLDPAVTLQTAVQAGNHPDLRWRDFTDFRSEIGRLYERKVGDFARLRGPPPRADVDRFDLALSVAAVRFVSALHRGRLNPRVVNAALLFRSPSCHRS